MLGKAYLVMPYQRCRLHTYLQVSGDGTQQPRPSRCVVQIKKEHLCNALGVPPPCVAIAAQPPRSNPAGPASPKHRGLQLERSCDTKPGPFHPWQPTLSPNLLRFVPDFQATRHGTRHPTTNTILLVIVFLASHLQPGRTPISQHTSCGLVQISCGQEGPL